jgi:fructose-bisphosphate aldolase, class II
MPLATMEAVCTGPLRNGGGLGAFNVIQLEHAEGIVRGAEAAARPVILQVRVVERCHARSVWVEAELGEVGGKDGVHAPGARTDPGEAAEFVSATDVDALAVAVGSSHAMATREAVLDNGLIARIADAVTVPLVLHGSSGVPDDGLVAAVDAGIRKVNIATHLNQAMTAEVRRVLTEAPTLTDPRRYLGPGRDAIACEIERLLVLLAPSPLGDPA